MKFELISCSLDYLLSHAEQYEDGRDSTNMDNLEPDIIVSST